MKLHLSTISFFLAASTIASALGDDAPVPDTVLPTGATISNPLRVFLQAGQSGCVGQSSVEELNADPNPSYEELKGIQEGVWFAGLQGGAKTQGQKEGGPNGSRFFIGPMTAGQDSKDRFGSFFGPEVSIGRRLADADETNNAPVLIVKYCWGGSNVEREWNPTSSDNSWDRTQDDGTALWLLENDVADLTSKNHLYVNLVYTIRRSLEALEGGSVPYELSGLFWLQGAADKDRAWQDYGDDLVALYQTLRTDIGAPDLPVVDTGAGGNNAPRTAKEYAASTIGNAVVAGLGLSVQNPDADCAGGAGGQCVGVNFPNWESFDYYGYDPLMDETFKPEGASDKIFHWFKSFPNNNHFEYEGDILKGRTLANTFIETFTEDELKAEWIEDDIQILFPVPVCDPLVNGGKPTETDLCWMDLRLSSEPSDDNENNDDVDDESEDNEDNEDNDEDDVERPKNSKKAKKIAKKLAKKVKRAKATNNVFDRNNNNGGRRLVRVRKV